MLDAQIPRRRGPTETQRGSRMSLGTADWQLRLGIREAKKSLF
jgi:hypothetical protein